MNKTQNYKLNQWEKSDRVQMEDFNADNAKLDAAVHEADSRLTAAVAAERTARISAVQAARDACPLVVLRSVTLTGNVSRYDLDLTGFNWNDYGEILIYMRLKSVESSADVSVLLNGRTGDQIYNDNYGNRSTLRDLSISSGGTSAICRVPRMESSFQCLWTDSLNWRSPAYAEPRDWYLSRDKFTAMNFVCKSSASPLAAGTRFTILGVRA